jgi:hypothetical protein
VCLQLLVRIHVVIVCLVLVRPVERNCPQLLRRTGKKRLKEGARERRE